MIRICVDRRIAQNALSSRGLVEFELASIVRRSQKWEDQSSCLP